MVRDIFQLLFPLKCPACGKSLFPSEKSICTRCLYYLPRTQYHLTKNNPVARLFWGRVKLTSASSFLRFSPNGRVQRLIHHIKYGKGIESAAMLGELYGKDLSLSNSFNLIDLIIPVPLHPRKEKKRGFNQSQIFAQGIAKSLGKPLDSSLVIRSNDTETQTKKSRIARWFNVGDAFRVEKELQLMGKHVLLVDDMVTTGATLEACANKILSVPGTSVSIATIAVSEI